MERNARNNYARIFIVIILLLLSMLSIASALTISSVATSPSQITPGGSATITLVIENNLKNDVKDVDVALDFSSALLPFAPYGASTEQHITKIAEGKEERLAFSIIALPKAESGVYKVPVKIKYLVNNETKAEDAIISLIIHADPQITLSAEGVLIAGKEQTITVRVINEGLADAKFVSMELQLPSSLQTASPTSSYLGDLASDDFDSVEYNIVAREANSKTITLPVMIHYRDSNNQEFTQKTSFTLPIYTQQEAQALGLLQKPNYILYGSIFAIILVFIVYRLLRKRKR